VGVALTGFFGSRADLAALALLENGTSVLLLAGTARLVARGPSGPRGNLAGHRAFLLLASASFLDVRARLATAGGLDLDEASTGFLTPAARCGARSPGLECGNFAVNRAGLGGALASFVEHRALLAASSFGDDGARTDLGASAASLVTICPRSELGDEAVSRALLGGAFLGLGERRARGTAKVGLGENSTATLLDAAAARLVAGTPLGE